VYIAIVNNYKAIVEVTLCNY